MSSIEFAINLAMLIFSFVFMIIFPIAVLYCIISAPYWIWEGYQVLHGKTTDEYLDNRPVFKFLFAPFKFYFCKLFRLNYKL